MDLLSRSAQGFGVGVLPEGTYVVPLFWGVALPYTLKPKPRMVMIIMSLQEELDQCVYNPPSADTIWLWVYSDKIPIYPIFYLFKGDYNSWSIFSSQSLQSECRNAGVIIRAFGVRRAWDGILGTRGLKLGQCPRSASNDRHNTSSRKPKS